MNIGLGNGHKPSPICAGVMFCSHRYRRLLLNTDKGQLDPIWSSQIAIQVERHYFFCLPFAARKIICFRLFQLFIFKPNGNQSLNVSSSFDIRTPVVAAYRPSRPPMLIYISDFYVVASTSLPLKSGPTENKSLASYKTALELAKR